MNNQITNNPTFDNRHSNYSVDFRKFRETVEKLEDLARKGLDKVDARRGLHATRELVEIWNELDPSQRAAVGIELVQDYYRRSLNGEKH
jgi:hypothetical protein